jgi:hypothetical protein
MKKKLNTDIITNELEGASLFFTKSASPLPAPEPEKPVTEKDSNPLKDSPFFEKAATSLHQAQNENKQDQKRTNVLSDVRTNERPIVGTNVRPTVKPKRQKIRHAFDIYQDQLFNLQMRQLEAVQKGKRKPRLGKMVQDAIDQYLKQGDNKQNRA